MTDIQTYRVPALNYPRLEDEIAKLNKRATKLKCQPIVLNILETITEKKRNEVVGFDYQETYHICTVSGETPKLAGWTLIAIIEPVPNGENLVREVPGEKCPARFRTTKMFCDHCSSTRKRNSIFLLKHEDGEYKQVGRQCLADFLGHEHPENLILKAEYLFSGTGLMRDAEEEGWWSGGGSLPPMIPTTEFVTVAAVVIRKMGWKPRSQVSEFEQATADIVWDICTRSGDRMVRELVQAKQLYASEDDIKSAEAAVAWGAAIDPANAHNTYLHDLGVCCRQNYVDHKRSGFAASVISAYRRTLLTPEKTTPSKHLGEIDKRQQFDNVTCRLARPIVSGIYEKTLVKFVDGEGNVLIWWASGMPDWVEVGCKYNIKATVKKHTEYQGVAQTEVNRVDPLDMPVVSG